jgi:acetyl-CoA carboxylase alpha subunit
MKLAEKFDIPVTTVDTPGAFQDLKQKKRTGRSHGNLIEMTQLRFP